MADRYISRDTAIARLTRLEVTDKLATMADAKREIADMPAADAAPVVHGSWISWEEADNFIPSAHRHECSVCHDAAQVLVNGLELLSDYCPNCGAKMDGKNGDDNASA